MANTKVPGVSLEQLNDEQMAKLQEEIENTRLHRLMQSLIALREEYFAVVNKIESVVGAYGLDASRLISMTNEALQAHVSKRIGRTAQRRRVPPKYRNPKNPDETWTGRGNMPLWVRAFLAEGGSLASIQIKAPKPAEKLGLTEPVKPAKVSKAVKAAKAAKPSKPSTTTPKGRGRPAKKAAKSR